MEELAKIILTIMIIVLTTLNTFVLLYTYISMNGLRNRIKAIDEKLDDHLEWHKQQDD